MPRTTTGVTEIASESTQVFRTSKKRYRLHQPIFIGPASSVWRARDTLTGRDVVVKRLEAGSVNDPVARQRLANEAAASELVSHPNSVPVVDMLFGRHEAALIFPFVAGSTLAARLREELPIGPRDAAAVALDVSDVLADAHAAGVVHRDVKPANILLGEDGRARLIDFGISRSIDEGDAIPGSNADTIELTGSGMVVGTLPYMAPEQLTGSQPSPAADVFALGVVLYEMLSGARPYDGRSPAEQLELQQRPPAPVQAPVALAALTMGALDAQPERRPSAAQFGRTLRAWLDGRADADAATTTLPIAPMRPASRTKAAVVALVGVFLAAILLVPPVLGLLGAATQPAEAIVAEPSAQPEQRAPSRHEPDSAPAAATDTEPEFSAPNPKDPNPGKDRKDKKPGRGNGDDDEGDDGDEGDD